MYPSESCAKNSLWKWLSVLNQNTNVCNLNMVHPMVLENCSLSLLNNLALKKPDLNLGLQYLWWPNQWIAWFKKRGDPPIHWSSSPRVIMGLLLLQYLIYQPSTLEINFRCDLSQNNANWANIIHPLKLYSSLKLPKLCPYVCTWRLLLIRLYL